MSKPRSPEEMERWLREKLVRHSQAQCYVVFGALQEMLDVPRDGPNSGPASLFFEKQIAAAYRSAGGPECHAA